MSETRVGVITPTRGDRPQFIKQVRHYVERQSVRPDYFELVNDKPRSSQKDLAYRCKLGTYRIAAKLADEGADPDRCFVLFMEDDDWYPFNYVNYMFEQWKKHKYPDLLGIDSTVYYNIKRRDYRTLRHPRRSSLMSTGAKLSALLSLDWEAVQEPFLDLYLWKHKKGVAMAEGKPVCIGIKHGIGLCGGGGHSGKRRNNIEDKKFVLLKQFVGNDINFYESIA